MTVDFESIEVTTKDGKVKVVLDYIGEGNSGDFDPNDEYDAPLIRYSVYRLFEESLEQDKIIQMCDTDAYEEGDWMAVNDASYCTNLSVNDEKGALLSAAIHILRAVESDVRDLQRNKRHWEELSHIHVDDLK